MEYEQTLIWYQIQMLREIIRNKCDGILNQCDEERAKIRKLEKLLIPKKGNLI